MYRYFLNPFMAVTNSNFKRALLMARDHRDKLSGYALSEPDIAVLFQEFAPVFDAYETAYAKVHTNAGSYRGHTQKMEELVQELSGTHIKQWDIWVQNVYLEGTAEYKMLFPQFRKPFQSGAYELRIDAVRTLSYSLSEFPELSNVKAAVDLFLEKINKTRTRQQQVEGFDTGLRQMLEDARVELAYAMHRVFGALLHKHYRKPEDMERYYELKYLQAPAPRETTQTDEKVVSANSRINLYDGQLTANSFITLKNTGTTPLRVFSSADTNALLPDDALEVLPDQTQSFYSTEVSNGDGFNWLILVNETPQGAVCEVAKEEVELE